MRFKEENFITTIANGFTFVTVIFENIGGWILRVSDEKMYHSTYAVTAYQLHAPACSFVAMSIEYYHR